MRFDHEWDFSRNDRAWRVEDTGMGMLRIALLFGSAAVAFALLVAPMIDQTRRSGYADGSAAGLDTISTGSVRATNSYTIRRSVLQPTPSSVCVIHDNGRRDGDC